MSDNVWEAIHARRAWGKYPNEELVRFVGRTYFKIPIQERKKIRILELGCGQGANLWFLAKENFSVYGIDASASAIEKAAAYLGQAYDVAADMSVGDIRELPFEDDFFDLVVDCATIQCLSFAAHRDAYLEVHRVLKTGGFFWSFHIAKGSWGYGSGKLIDHETFDNLREGPAADLGVICTPSDTDLTSLLQEEFETLDVEKCTLTYQNQVKEIAHWIITSRKK